jgi:hypothetical protein
MLLITQPTFPESRLNDTKKITDVQTRFTAQPPSFNDRNITSICFIRENADNVSVFLIMDKMSPSMHYPTQMARASEPYVFRRWWRLLPMIPGFVSAVTAAGCFFAGVAEVGRVSRTCCHKDATLYIYRS